MRNRSDVEHLLVISCAATTRRRVMATIATIIGVLFVLSIPQAIASVVFHRDHLLGLSDLFNLDAEQSVPNWFSSLLLFFAATVTGAIAYVKRVDGDPFRRHWLALTLLITALSAEEIANAHGALGKLIKQSAQLPPIFTFAWTIPGFVIVLVIMIGFARFWRNLPDNIRAKFLAATLVYFGCAIGFELFESKLFAEQQQLSFAYAAFTAIEETGEMVGATMLINALLIHLGDLGIQLRLSRGGRARADVVPIARGERDPRNALMSSETLG